MLPKKVIIATQEHSHIAQGISLLVEGGFLAEASAIVAQLQAGMAMDEILKLGQTLMMRALESMAEGKPHPDEGKTIRMSQLMTKDQYEDMRKIWAATNSAEKASALAAYMNGSETITATLKKEEVEPKYLAYVLCKMFEGQGGPAKGS